MKQVRPSFKKVVRISNKRRPTWKHKTHRDPDRLITVQTRYYGRDGSRRQFRGKRVDVSRLDEALQLSNDLDKLDKPTEPYGNFKDYLNSYLRIAKKSIWTLPKWESDMLKNRFMGRHPDHTNFNERHNYDDRPAHQSAYP